MQPLESAPAVYLPPANGASIFFERVDVSLDGQDIIKDVEVSNLQFVYQALNRAFSTYGQRRKLGQEVSITCSKDVSNLAEKSERLKAAMQPLQNVTWETPTTLFLQFGFDGLMFLSAPRNLALARLQEHWQNDNLTLPPGEIRLSITVEPFLPPHGPFFPTSFQKAGSALEITLHKREPFHLGLEWPGISVGTYFSTTADASNGMKNNLTFTIQSMGLCYESTVMANSQKISSDLQKGSLNLYFDIPKLSYQALQPQQQRLHMSVLVPAGSKACFLAFMFGHQLWEHTADKKNISGRTRFPKSLRKLLLSVAGHESLAFRAGFDGIGGAGGYSSESCRNYFEDLRAQGVIDWDFEEMFPRDPNKSSFIQALFLDLRGYRIKKNTTMFVEMEFSSNLSPPKTYLVTVFLREVSLYKARGVWNTKITDE